MNKGLYTITQLRYDISDMFDFGKGDFKDISHFDNFIFKEYEYEVDYFKFSSGGYSIKKTQLDYENIKKVVAKDLETLILKQVSLDEKGLIKNDSKDIVKYTIGNLILKETIDKTEYNISIPFNIHKGILENGEIIFKF